MAEDLDLDKLHKWDLACANGDFDTVKAMVAEGWDVNADDGDPKQNGWNAGWNGLFRAACFGHFDIVKYLVENGATVGHRTRSGYTALNLAAGNGYIDICRYLLSIGHPPPERKNELQEMDRKDFYDKNGERYKFEYIFRDNYDKIMEGYGQKA